MTKPDFEKFVDKTLDEIFLFAEIYTKRIDLNEREFQWLIKDSPVVTERREIISAITSVVFIAPDKIYPCVDLQIMEVKDKTIVLKAWFANYEPRPFGKGWSNRPGPFIYVINQTIIHPAVNTNSKAFLDTLKDKGLLHQY